MQDYYVIKVAVLEVRDVQGKLKALVSRDQTGKENIFYSVSEMGQDEIKEILEIIANKVEIKKTTFKKDVGTIEDKG